mmetsp:Transcript_47680/g.77357  ORF Transcript_47680/g.77357 Transcript_47680/m.77357 type:complete len:282 (-) Transcript_47680:240-1085(-)
MHMCTPVDVRVRTAFRVELRAQRRGDGVRRGFEREAPGVEPAHWQVHHPTVAPEPARVQREPVWKKPHFRRHRRDAFPLIDTQHCKPEFGPGGCIQSTPMLSHEFPALDARGRVDGRPHQPQGHVIQHRAKHCAWRFDVCAPPSIFLLMVQQVSLYSTLMWTWKNLVDVAGDVGSYDEARQQKVRAAIIACPLPILALNHLVEAEALPGCLEWSGGRCGGRSRPSPVPEAGRPENAVACVGVDFRFKHMLLLSLIERSRTVGIGENPHLLAGHFVRQKPLL